MTAKRYRDPSAQAQRWVAQANAWVCASGCGHGVEAHREHAPTFQRDSDGYLVEVPHPRYRPMLFVCTAQGCTCELDRSAN